MTNSTDIRFVLASASPRRKELMNRLEIPCEIISADIDEQSIPYKTPREMAIKVAYAKACAVEEQVTPPAVIIAADTVVVLDGKVYGKPTDEADARRMLGELSGRRHTVITGVAVRESGKMSALLDAVETTVEFRNLSQQEINDYVSSGEPLDKAGAYGAQGRGRSLIRTIEGDYYNVVGLPLNRLLDMLDNFAPMAEFRGNLKNLCTTGRNE